MIYLYNRHIDVSSTDQMETVGIKKVCYILIITGITSPLISTAYQARKPFPSQARNPSSA